jgi:hypothetical protein
MQLFQILQMEVAEANGATTQNVNQGVQTYTGN